MRHPVRVSVVSGALTTSLPEDVFHLVDTQLTLLHEFLVAKGIVNEASGTSATVDAVHSIVSSLTYHHTRYRFMFLQNLESCIAFANDLMRMLEKKEGMQEQLKVCFPRQKWGDLERGDSQTLMVRRELSQLASMYSEDATNACQRAVNFVMQSIQASRIPNELFSREWEDVMVHNEVAVSIVKSIADYLADIEEFVEHPFLYHKIVASLVRGIVCFYMQCLVKKAHTIRRVMKRDFSNKRAKRWAFMSSKRAVTRISYDVQVFQDFFLQVAEGHSLLARLITDELFVLVILIECMWLAVGRKHDNLEEFILVVHQKISGANSAVTRHLLSDIWLLLGDKDEYRSVEQEVRLMDLDLQRLSAGIRERGESRKASVALAMSSRNTSLRLDEVLKCLYEDRVAEETLSLCGSLGKYVKPDSDLLPKGKIWDPLKGIKRHFASDQCEQELSSMFKKL
jgi:hypothetical protein